MTNIPIDRDYDNDNDADHMLVMHDPDVEHCEDCDKLVPDGDKIPGPDECHCTRCIDCRELLDDEERQLGHEQCFDCFVTEHDRD
jgi:hypothetical protein